MGEIAVLEKQNKEFNEKNETNYDCNVSTEFVKRIMSPRVVLKCDTTIDDLADVFSYTDQEEQHGRIDQRNHQRAGKEAEAQDPRQQGDEHHALDAEA